MSDDGEVLFFPIKPEVARRLDEKDGPDAPVRRAEGWRDCLHKRVTLDVTARCLRCRECEQVIDPIDWIEHLAHEWEHYIFRWRTGRSKVAAIEERVAELERIEKNARARLRRLNEKLVEKGEEPEELRLWMRHRARA